jgi:hypothetical protein
MDLRLREKPDTPETPNPTPNEIAAMTRAIRAKWSVKERHRRCCRKALPVFIGVIHVLPYADRYDQVDHPFTTPLDML